MSDNVASEKYKELCFAMRERDRAIRLIESLDKKIAELAGLIPAGEQRKPAKKTYSGKEFRKLAGV